jgi:hypothetical protein
MTLKSSSKGLFFHRREMVLTGGHFGSWRDYLDKRRCILTTGSLNGKANLKLHH